MRSELAPSHSMSGFTTNQVDADPLRQGQHFGIGIQIPQHVSGDALGQQRRDIDPVAEQHHRLRPVILPGYPAQPLDVGALRMDRFRPLPRIRVLVLFRVDQLPTLNPQFPQRHIAQIGQYEIVGGQQDRMSLTLQLAFILALEARRKRYVVEHCLHDSAIESGAAIEGWNRISARGLDRAETGIAFQSRVESVGRVQILVDAVDELILAPCRLRDMQDGGWQWRQARRGECGGCRRAFTHRLGRPFSHARSQPSRLALPR